MANIQARRSQNVSGDFYVDSSCIDCDTCRWMSPTVFSRMDEQSAVYHQPNSTAERQAALQALLACPTASIGTVEKPQDIKAAQQSFPIPITEQIYHCGYHAESSFGAASYLITQPEGNILVDSPRFTPPLVKRLEALGGMRWLYLTHRDDVADHAKFQAHFGCDRLLHQDDITANTQAVEIQLTGTAPIEDVLPHSIILPVPGHTEGHTVLLWQNRVLFTGDHLSWSARLNHLAAFRNFCWYSWPRLKESMYKLAVYDFEWILPGHGRRHQASPEQMRRDMQVCLDWMERV
ncbi:MAG: MBL fold metallo-hydrolase [Spirulina sp. SIO3F2]|nr:MBL fold metallo-hydrolase [Spirulina sp. SIO3F2]